MRRIRALLAAAAAAFVAPAQALVVAGTTARGPEWNRPIEGTPPTGLSLTGTAVPYSALLVTVSLSGNYVFQSTATDPANWDNFTFLYSPAFNPRIPLSNVLVGNDDNGATGLSGFTAALTAGTNYTFVTTGFRNSDEGAWSLSIVGPGTVSAGPPRIAVSAGTTLGGPVWNRPLDGTPPTGLSLVGTAVPYSAVQLTVPVSGSYLFESAATSPLSWDNFTFLYSPAFNPATALTNVLIGNDEYPTTGRSGFVFTLTAGTSYTFVTTGFGNDSVGAWNLSITGPGTITFGPPPIDVFADGFENAIRRR